MKSHSVTAMLGKHSGFEDVPDYYMIPAQIRGTAVHRYCAAVAKKVFPEPLPIVYRGFGVSFEKFFPATEETIFCEERLECPELGYHGHPDMVLRMKVSHKRRLIDLKTGAFQKTWFLQLSAYWYLLKVNGIEIDEAGDLILDPDGDMPRYIPHENFKIDFGPFYGGLQLHHYLYDGEKGDIDAGRI
jgi:hypothetical protein